MSKKKINPDHVRRRNRPSTNDEVIEKQFKELLSPSVLSQASYYQSLGMRNRILNLPLMVASILTLIWWQVPSVHELTRMLNREELLWCKTVKVRQQSLSERFLIFPAVLFERVYKDLVPRLIGRWNERKARPLPPAIAHVQCHFDEILVAHRATQQTSKENGQRAERAKEEIRPPRPRLPRPVRPSVQPAWHQQQLPPQ